MRYRIIAFTGALQSGKTTCANLLSDAISYKSKYYPKHINFNTPTFKLSQYAKELGLISQESELDLRDKFYEKQINLWRMSVRSFQFKASGQHDDNFIALTDDVTTDDQAKQVKAMNGFIINVSRNTDAVIDDKLIDLNIYNDKDKMALRLNIKYLFEEGLL